MNLVESFKVFRSRFSMSVFPVWGCGAKDLIKEFNFRTFSKYWYLGGDIFLV